MLSLKIRQIVLPILVDFSCAGFIMPFPFKIGSLAVASHNLAKVGVASSSLVSRSNVF